MAVPLLSHNRLALLTREELWTEPPHAGLTEKRPDYPKHLNAWLWLVVLFGEV